MAIEETTQIKASLQAVGKVTVAPSIFYTVYTKNANFSCIIDRRSVDNRYRANGCLSLRVHHGPS